MTVLNPPLYNALMRAFGNVGVSNEGDPVEVECSPSTDLTKRKGPQKAQFHGGERYIIDCPYCGDTRGRLWISYAFGTPVLFNGKEVVADSFGAICYNEDCLSFEAGNRPDFRSRIVIDPADVVAMEAVSVDEEREDNTEIPVPYGVPVDSPEVPAYVWEYLTGRGLNPKEMAQEWDVKVGLIPFYKPYPCLLFPVVSGGRCKGYQARKIGSKPEAKPKYFIPHGFRKSWHLYNFDKAGFYPDAPVLVEGVTDVMALGRRGIAMLGKKPSDRQIRLMRRWESIIWMPDENDPQSIDNAMKMSKVWVARKLFKQVEVVRLPHSDPGSFPRKELWNLIQKQAPALM